MGHYVLLIDTSIFGAAVGVSSYEPSQASGAAAKLLWSSVTPDVQSSAKQLPLVVDRAFKELHISSNQVSRIIVARGPGSFTGIRVGIAYAFGFFAGLTASDREFVKISGVSSLSLLADHVARQRQKGVALFLPSTKTTGFVAYANGVTTGLEAVDVGKGLADHFASLDWIVLGSWDSLADLKRSQWGGTCENLDPRENAQLALQVISDRLGLTDDFPWSNEMPTALYLRKSTVEEKADAGG
jgi:tRNA A37 threonylcarbamoyladenosine modification protein TsaB